MVSKFIKINERLSNILNISIEDDELHQKSRIYQITVTIVKKCTKDKQSTSI